MRARASADRKVILIRHVPPVHAVPLIRVYIFLLMVFPSQMVFQPVGAAASPAGLLGILAFFLWVAASILGLHDPLARRNPTRSAFFALWIVSLFSYAEFNLGEHTAKLVNGADRWLMQLACWSGIALVTAECLHTHDAVRKIERALVTGGAFCGFVAALQYWVGFDLAPTLRSVPGFQTVNALDTMSVRSGLSRVVGTSLTPIELGVVSAMILPLAIHLRMFDEERSSRIRTIMLILVAVGVPVAVSRSSVIAAAIAVGLFVVLLPPRQRVAGFGFFPVALLAVFMVIPGLIGTMKVFFLAGTSDASIRARVDDYPMVERLVAHSPWIGSGGGTYLPDVLLEILDNQYLKTAIELGMIGLVVLVVCLFGVPVVAAFTARRRATDPELRALCAALGPSVLAAAVCSFTFDSLAFPMCAGVLAVLIGLIGASWRLATFPPTVGAVRSAPHQLHDDLTPARKG
jgi:hypothetical protein